MNYFLLAACIVVSTVFAVAFNALFQLFRVQQREAQRRETELLNRLMFMADRPYVEPPIQEERIRPEFKEEDEIYLPEAHVAEYN